MITSYENISIFSMDKDFIKAIKQAIKPNLLLNSAHSQILVIDERYRYPFNNVKDNPYKTYKKIHIVENISYEEVTKLLSSKDNYIIQHPINKDLLNGIIWRLTNNDDETEYHGIKLNKKENYFEYRSCKIALSPTESLILKVAMEYEGFCDIQIVNNYSSNPISKCYLQVIVNRINKKTQNITGVKIMRNNNRAGYRIII